MPKIKLTHEEKAQIAYLQQRKSFLIDQFIGACEEINDQIKAVKNGEWKKAQEAYLDEREKE